MAKVKNNTDLTVRVTDKTGFCLLIEAGETREIPEAKVALCQGQGLSLVSARANTGSTKAPKTPKAPADVQGDAETLTVNPD